MNKKNIVLASLCHFLCDINTGALPAIVPYLINAYGMSYSAASGLMLANSSLSSFIQPLFGLLSDRSPRKIYFMPLGICIAAFGMSVLGFLEQYYAIFLAVGLSGIGAALFHPAAMRFTNSVSSTRQGTGTSIFSVGGNIGFLLAPIFAVFLIEHLGLKGLSVLFPIAVVMSLFVVYEIRHIALTTAAKISTAANTQSACTNDWSAFTRLTFAIICRSVIMVCLRVFFPLYLIAYFSHSTAEAAFILTVFGLGGILGNILGGMLADRFGYIFIIKFSYIIMVPLLFVFPYIQNIWLLYADLIAISLFLYASYSPIVVLGQKYLARNIGFSSGITLGLSISIGGLFSPVLGWIADSYGLVSVFYTFGIIGLLGSFFAMLLVPVSQKIES